MFESVIRPFTEPVTGESRPTQSYGHFESAQVALSLRWQSKQQHDVEPPTRGSRHDVLSLVNGRDPDRLSEAQQI